MVAIFTIQTAFRAKKTIFSQKTRKYAISGHFRPLWAEMVTIRKVYHLTELFGRPPDGNIMVVASAVNLVTGILRRGLLIVDFLKP